MEQGIRILIQLVLEFAPAIANLVQKRGKVEGLSLGDVVNSEGVRDLLGMVRDSLVCDRGESEYEQQKNLQMQLATTQRQTQVEIAAKTREMTLQLPEVNRILDSWPLRLYPSQILTSHAVRERTPLKIFLAPPQINFDRFIDSNYDKNSDKNPEIFDMELRLAEGLRDFLNRYYALQSPLRPTEFLAGAWCSKRFHSESSMKALFGMLKSEPTLILESETDGDFLNFRIGYWGLGQDNYYYKTISRIAYKQIINDSAKTRALEWKQIRDNLLALGEPIEEINCMGGDNVANLATLEKCEKWRAQGIDTSKLSLEYQINRQDYEQLSQVLVNCHCLVASWVADLYHLVHHEVSPLLPELLPQFVESGLDNQAIATIAEGYKQVYQTLECDRTCWIPELALQLAQSLSPLPESRWSKEQLDYSLQTWLQLHNIKTPSEANCDTSLIANLQAMHRVVKISDEEYLEKLKSYFIHIGDRASLDYVEQMLAEISHLKQQRQELLVYPQLTLSGHGDAVTSVAISADGITAVSGSADKTVKVWNLQTGKIIRTLTGHTGEISSVAVSPDGNFLAVGISDTPRSNVKVWHLPSGKLIHTLIGHNKPVNVVAISPDGQVLASGSNKIKIWNLQKGDRVCTLWHSTAVRATAIAPDGTILVSGTSDHKIKIWNPQTGEPLHTIIGHQGAVTSLVLCPITEQEHCGQIVISGSADRTIKVWDIHTGKVLYTMSGHGDEITSLAMSQDGHTLISGSKDKTIKIWDWHRGELLQTLTGHDQAVNSVAISADGQIILSGSSDRKLKVWQLN